MINHEIQTAVDFLTQQSYNQQRKLRPDVSAERWALVFGKDEQKSLEINFQKGMKALTTAQK
jgi:hypothetical protein